MLAFFPSRQRLSTAAAIGALLLAVAGCTPAGPRAVLKGERLLQQGRVNDAIEHLERAVELMPNEARAWNQLGLAYHAAGRAEDAERAYRAALDRDRDLAVARFNLGNLLLEQGQADRAVPELTTYTGLRVNAPEGWLRLGHAQLQSGQPAAAERSFLRAYQLQTNSAAALNGIGLSLAQRARYTNAWQYFAAALQRQPDYAPALLNAGVLAQQHLRETNLAIQVYERYLALPQAPRKSEVETLLARLRTPAAPPPDRETGPAEEAAEATRISAPAPAAPEESATSTASRPSSTPADQSTEAAETTAEAPPAEIADTTAPIDAPNEAAAIGKTKTPPLEDTPDEARLRTTDPAPSMTAGARREPSLAGVSTQRVEGLPRENITVSTQAVVRATPARTEPPPQPPRAPAEVDLPPALQGLPGERYPYYAYGQPRAGDRNEAIRLLNLGINDQRALRTQLALESYRQAVEVDPSLFETHYNRGVAAFELGELPEAMRAYERALSINPDSVPARFNFAATLQRAGYWIDAAAQLSALVEAHPEEARAHLALGNLYADQFRDNPRAIEHYRRVLELEPQHPNATSLRFWIEAH